MPPRVVFSIVYHTHILYVGWAKAERNCGVHLTEFAPQLLEWYGLQIQDLQDIKLKPLNITIPETVLELCRESLLVMGCL